MRLRGPMAVNRPPKCQRNGDPPSEIISEILDHTGIFNVSFAFVELCRIKRAECPRSGRPLVSRIILSIYYLPVIIGLYLLNLWLLAKKYMYSSIGNILLP